MPTICDVLETAREALPLLGLRKLEL